MAKGSLVGSTEMLNCTFLIKKKPKLTYSNLFYPFIFLLELIHHLFFQLARYVTQNSSTVQYPQFMVVLIILWAPNLIDF